MRIGYNQLAERNCHAKAANRMRPLRGVDHPYDHGEMSFFNGQEINEIRVCGLKKGGISSSRLAHGPKS